MPDLDVDAEQSGRRRGLRSAGADNVCPTRAGARESYDSLGASDQDAITPAIMRFVAFETRRRVQSGELMAEMPAKPLLAGCWLAGARDGVAPEVVWHATELKVRRPRACE